MRKRMISFLTFLALCLSILPASVWAQGTTPEVRYSSDGGASWKEGRLLDDAIWEGYNSQGDFQIELLRDITLTDENWYSGPVLAAVGKSVTIDGKGYRIIRGGSFGTMFSVNAENSTVTLKNITIDGGAVWSGEDPASRTNSGFSFSLSGHLFDVADGGTLILDAGTILQNNHLTSSNSYGAAISVASTGAGELVMKDGVEIRGNTSGYGGAVYLWDEASFTMEGGKIYGNYATGEGGAVNVKSSSVFIMESGDIYGNAAGSDSGAVCMAGEFTMSGGSIYENQSNLGGGGVSVFSPGEMSMSGGSITDNTITGNLGGGVLVYSGSLDLSGSSVISGNTINGTTLSNVYLQSGKTINLSAALTDRAFVGVTTAAAPTSSTPVDITGSNSADYSSYFSSDNANYSIQNGAGNVVLLAGSPTSVPSAPKNLMAVEDVEAVKLSWEESDDAGGSAISGYQVSADGGATWVEASSDTEHTFTGLDGGVEYTFQVRAVNSAGGGEIVETEATPIIPVYTISVAADGNGTVSGGGIYSKNDTVSLTATPDSGFQFVNWTENGVRVSSSAEYQFAATADRALIAVFKEEESNSGSSGNSGGSGGSGGSGSLSVTVPMSGEESTIHIAARISGTTATVSEIGMQHLDQVIGEHVETGMVEIDLTGFKTVIDAVNLPTTAVREIAWAAETHYNDTDGLTVKLSAGQASFDAAALRSMEGQAGSQINLKLLRIETSVLSPRQRAVVGAAPVYDLALRSGAKEISDLGGGYITVSLPYLPEQGQDPSGIVVYYLDEEGEIFPCETTYDVHKETVVFTASQPSLYFIGYDESRAWENPFRDVSEDAWYYNAVKFVYQKGLMAGVGSFLFEPDADASRGMIVFVLWRMDGGPEIKEMDTGFADVASGAYYTQAVNWAVKNGIAAGYGNGCFGPDDSVTREQMAVMLHHYAVYKSMEDVTSQGGLAGYADAGDISDYAIQAMNWTVDRGVMKGKSGGVLAPKGSATRAEAAQMFMSILGLS